MIANDIKRLSFTIGKGNKPNATDIEALNGIIEYVNKERERQFNRNDLFAKLAISILKQDIIKSGGNYKLAMKTLVDLCKIDLDDTLDRFVLEVNVLQLENEINEKGIDGFNDYPKWDKTLLKEKMIEIITNLLN